MTEPAKTDRPGNGIDSAVETLLGQRPFLEPILRPIAAVCREKAMLEETLSGDGAPCPIIADASRLERGDPLCDGSNVRLLEGPIRRCFQTMLDVLERSISGFDRRAAGIADPANGPDLAALAGALLDGNGAAVAEAAVSAGAEGWMLDLAVRTGLSPVLGWVGASCGGGIGHVAWENGHCPVCGSMPSISSIEKACDLGSEYLVSGGGRRFLHCSLCGFRWSIPRNMCPACRSDDHVKRMYYRADGFSHERLDVCLECRGYLPCIDLRETLSSPPMEIAAAGMIHLDIWAARNGYLPLTRTPWNGVGG